MRPGERTIVRILILIQMLLGGAASVRGSDFQTVKTRMLADAVDRAGFRVQTERYHGTQLGRAREYISSMGDDGSWTDIDYADKDNDWAPLKHLDRVLVMAYAFRSDTSGMRGSLQALDALEHSIDFWYRAKPVCRNWYKNDIAKQFYLGPIGLMLEEDLSDSLLAKIVADLTPAPAMTGANRTALSTSVIYRAVIEGDESRLAAGVEGIAGSIVTTPGDGIQEDFSFQQHGGLLSTGTYGIVFLRDVSWLGAIVAGTRWELSGERIALLRNAWNEGSRWLLRGGLVDYSSRGREIGSPAGLQDRGRDFLPILGNLATIDSIYRSGYMDAYDAIAANAMQPVHGTRHYWRSDYSVAQRKSWFTSLKMCSERTIGIERNVNSENLLGYWAPYGLTYIHRRGDEYRGIFPLWNWATLPGVTSPRQEVTIVSHPKVYTTQSTSFVGGVSDGVVGVSAMDFAIDSTRAKKAWFWFEREWVGLGAQIGSDHSMPISTGVNQAWLRGPVVLDGDSIPVPAVRSHVNPSWVLHDSVAYLFPMGGTVGLVLESRSGSMKRIDGLGSDSVVQGNVFELRLDHGVRPQDASYAYVVVPGVDESTARRYSADLPVEILANSSGIQAVRRIGNDVAGIVFHSPGSVAVSGSLSLEVDHPCLVIVDRKAERLTVSEPTGLGVGTTITARFRGFPQRSTYVAFPVGAAAGSSIGISGLLERGMGRAEILASCRIPDMDLSGSVIDSIWRPASGPIGTCRYSNVVGTARFSSVATTADSGGIGFRRNPEASGTDTIAYLVEDPFSDEPIPDTMVVTTALAAAAPRLVSAFPGQVAIVGSIDTMRIPVAPHFDPSPAGLRFSYRSLRAKWLLSIRHDTLLMVPRPGCHGHDTIAVRATSTSGSGAFARATFTIQLRAANVAPFRIRFRDLARMEDAPDTTLDLGSGFRDPDDSLEFHAESRRGLVDLSIAGRWLALHQRADAWGRDTIILTARERRVEGRTIQDTILANLWPANDVPIAVGSISDASSAAGFPDTLRIALSPLFRSPDGEVRYSAHAARGKVVVAVRGDTLLIASRPGHHGTDTISVRASEVGHRNEFARQVFLIRLGPVPPAVHGANHRMHASSSGGRLAFSGGDERRSGSCSSRGFRSRPGNAGGKLETVLPPIAFRIPSPDPSAEKTPSRG